MTTTTKRPISGSLAVPGAQLHHEVRGSGPAVLLIGNPMDANAFAPLAELLAVDHTVVTTDPRGINRSPVDDPDAELSVEGRADDLAVLLRSLEVGPAVVVGSSGGAVSALALAQLYPELVRTVVAHEPPLEELLPDRDRRRAATDAMIATYLSGDVAGAWAMFLGEANIEMADDETGPVLPADPDPQAAADERFFFEHLLRPSTTWRPDLAVLRDSAARLVVGIGETSTGQTCDATSHALAEGLGITATAFPGGHLGFIEDPAAFAERLRAVLESGAHPTDSRSHS